MAQAKSPITATVSAAVEPYRRLAVDSNGKFAHAAVGQPANGYSRDRATAANERVAMDLRTAGSTIEITAAGAISIGANCYPAAAGKVSATQIGAPEGIALTSAGADGDVIKMLPLVFAGGWIKKHTVSAGEDTANAATIDLGTGANPTGPVIVLIKNVSNVYRVPQGAVTATAGVFTVADSGLAVNEEVHIFVGI